jgi:hypothetical protein
VVHAVPHRGLAAWRTPGDHRPKPTHVSTDAAGTSRERPRQLAQGII